MLFVYEIADCGRQLKKILPIRIKCIINCFSINTIQHLILIKFVLNANNTLMKSNFRSRVVRSVLIVSNEELYNKHAQKLVRLQQNGFWIKTEEVIKHGDVTE